MRITRKMVEDAFSQWTKNFNSSEDKYFLQKTGKKYRIKAFANVRSADFPTRWVTGREMYLMLAFANTTKAINPPRAVPKTMADVKPRDTVQCVNNTGCPELVMDGIYIVETLPEHDVITVVETNFRYMRFRFIPVS